MLGAAGTEGSQGQLFPFSPSPSAKRGVGAETSAAAGSVFPPKDKHDLLPATPPLSQPQPQEQGWLLVISAHRLARQSCVPLLHAFLLFISLILKP